MGSCRPRGVAALVVVVKESGGATPLVVVEGER
jgi:hypothetical protein